MSIRDTTERAQYGSAAYEIIAGGLPVQYPRTIGPNAMKYLQEVVDGGFSRSNTMVERFECRFAEKYTEEDCHRAQEIVAKVANRNRR